MAKKLDPAIALIRANRGMAVRIAEALGIDKQAVYQWKKVPPLRVLTVSEIIGMPPEKIRPDVFKK
jgi:hypothetical protein